VQIKRVDDNVDWARWTRLLPDDICDDNELTRRMWREPVTTSLRNTAASVHA